MWGWLLNIWWEEPTDAPTQENALELFTIVSVGTTGYVATGYQGMLICLYIINKLDIFVKNWSYIILFFSSRDWFSYRLWYNIWGQLVAICNENKNFFIIFLSYSSISKFLLVFSLFLEGKNGCQTRRFPWAWDADTVTSWQLH